MLFRSAALGNAEPDFVKDFHGLSVPHRMALIIAHSPQAMLTSAKTGTPCGSVDHHQAPAATERRPIGAPHVDPLYAAAAATAPQHITDNITSDANTASDSIG